MVKMPNLNALILTWLFLFIFPLCALCIEPGALNCTDQNTFCSASCDFKDVQAAADSAMASGLADTTIYIPACSPNPYTWSAGQKLLLQTDPSRAIRLIGSGKDTTVIKHFQIDVPESTNLNLVELGYLGCDGNQTVVSMLDYRLRPETLNTELYWHHFSVDGYTGGSTLTFEGWRGVVSNVEMTCHDRAAGQNAYGITVHGDGIYSDHSVDFGTRNAFFIEDSTFDSCSHTVSSFCDGFVVFRNNNVRNSDSHTDLHGPGYNYCYYNPDEKTAGGGMELYDNNFVQSQGNWVINARAGQGHIYTDNRFDSDTYKILLYWDSGSNTYGNNCGTDAGETCGRCYTIDCEGCCQAQEKTYIWENDGSVMEYVGGSADDCLIEGTTYFLREPTLAEDGFVYTKFTYPHPLAANGAGPNSDNSPDSGDDRSGTGCFVYACLWIMENER